MHGDARYVRIFNERMEQVAMHTRIEAGKFSCTGLFFGLEVRLQEAEANRLPYAEFLELVFQDKSNVRHQRMIARRPFHHLRIPDFPVFLPHDVVDPIDGSQESATNLPAILLEDDRAGRLRSAVAWLRWGSNAFRTHTAFPLGPTCLPDLPGPVERQ